MSEFKMEDTTPEGKRLMLQSKEFDASIPTDEASLRRALDLLVHQRHRLSKPVRPDDADVVMHKGIRELLAARERIAVLTRERDDLLKLVYIDSEHRFTTWKERAETDGVALREAHAELSKARAETERLTRERDEARADLEKVAAAHKMIGSSAEEIAAAVEGLLQAAITQDTANEELVESLRQSRAENARLRGALEALSWAERHYRDMYQRHGGQALDTGRAWDMLRNAGHAALARLGEGR